MKLALVVLALAAPLSLSYFFSALQGTATLISAVSPAPVIGDADIPDDKDGDGLKNRDENLWRTDWQNPDTDGDGFKDGEEVLSGHDPRKKGPNDFVDRNKNLTESLSTLLLGGIVKGDLNPASDLYETSLSAVIDSLYEDYQKLALAPRSVNMKTVPDSARALADYLVAMKPHLEEAFSESMSAVTLFLRDYSDVSDRGLEKLFDDEKRHARMVERALGIAQDLESQAKNLAAIPAPLSVARAHRNGIVLLQHMSEQLTIVSEMQRDPVKGILAMQTLAELSTRTVTAFAYDYALTFHAAFEKFKQTDTAP